MYRQIFLAEFDLGKFYMTDHNQVQWANGVALEPHVTIIIITKWPTKPSVSLDSSGISSMQVLLGMDISESVLHLKEILK